MHTGRQSHKYEQQHVAVRPGNAHFISIHQVSPNAATLVLLCIGNVMLKN